MKEKEIIYVLTNPLMPDLVMIGKIEKVQEDDKVKQIEILKKHVQNLSSPRGVPAPFEIYCAWNVDNNYLKKVYNNFADYIINPYQDSFKGNRKWNSIRINPKWNFFRINPARNFFRVNPERVFLFLKDLEIKEAKEAKETKEIEDTEDITGQEERLSNRKRRMKTKLKFYSLGIPPGSALTFIRDNDIKATVANDDLNVILEGKKDSISLWEATLNIMDNKFDRDWSNDHGPNFWGPDCWVYENESLSERRIRMESGE